MHSRRREPKSRPTTARPFRRTYNRYRGTVQKAIDLFRVSPQDAIAFLKTKFKKVRLVARSIYELVPVHRGKPIHLCLSTGALIT